MSAELRDELNPYADGLPTEVQDKISERYKEIFGLFLKHQDKISRVTFWGVTDGDSWKNNWPGTGQLFFQEPLASTRQHVTPMTLERRLRQSQSTANR